MGLLRLLLAVCVFCGHSRAIGNLAWLPADLAVEVFFVISGFYMQLVLSTKYTKARLGKSWREQFYKARYFRLLPAYVLASSVALIAESTRPHSAWLSTWRYLGSLPATAGNVSFKAFAVLTNTTMLFQDATLFFAAHNSHIVWSSNFAHSDIQLWQALLIPPAWSLGIELSFYAVAPFLLKLNSRWLVILVGVSAIAKIAALKVLLLHDPWTYRFFPFELSCFLMGALAFRCSRLLIGIPIRALTAPAYAIAVTIIFLSPADVLGKAIYPLGVATLVPIIFHITARYKFDRLIGELSYPFYLLHLQGLSIGSMAQRALALPAAGKAWLGLAATLTASAVVVFAEFRFIEPWRARLSQTGELSDSRDQSFIAAAQSDGTTVNTRATKAAAN